MGRRDRDGISRIEKLANWFIWVVTAVIALVFAGLTLKDIPFAAISDANPAYVQAIVLSIYVWCWAVGTTFDTSIQGSVYLVDPHGGRLRAGSVIAVLSLAAISIVLLLFRSDEPRFALALLVFTSLDITTWLYLRFAFLPPIIKASREKHAAAPPDYYGQIQLDVVVSQIIGNWKWWREGALFVIVMLIVVVALSPRVKDALAGALYVLIPAVEPSKVRALIPDLLLLLFVLVSEVWHFAVRLQTMLTLKLLDKLEDRFSIRPRGQG